MTGPISEAFVSIRPLIAANFGAEVLAAVDKALASVEAAANKTAAATNKNTAAAEKAAKAETAAAEAAQAHAAALERVNRVLAQTAGGSVRVQKSELQLVAAQERLNTVLESGKATTESLASAQARLVGAEESVFNAHEAVYASSTKAAEAADRQAAASTRSAEAADLQAAGIARVNAALESTAGLETEVRLASLNLVAADERLAVAQQSAATSAAGLATAYAGVIRAEEGLTQASLAAGAAANRIPGAFAGVLKSAKQLGLLVGAFELAKKGLDIVKQTNEFNSSVTRVQTVVGRTTAEVADMRAGLLDLAGKTATAPDQLAVSLIHAASTGLDAANSLKEVEIAAEGAKVGNANLEDTTNALNATIVSGIVPAGHFSEAMAQILTIVGTGDQKLQDFNEALSSGGLAKLQTYGLNLRDVGAALAVFGDNNLRGRLAIQSLVQSVQSLAVVSPKGQKELAKLGITANELRKDLQTGGLNLAITDLRTHLLRAGVGAKETGAILTEIFTKRAGAGLSILLEEMDRLNLKYAIIDKNTNNFGQRFADTTKTIKFQLQQITANVDTAGIRVVDSLQPIFHAVIDDVVALGPPLADLGHLLKPVAQVIGFTLLQAFKGIGFILRDVVDPVLHELASILHSLPHPLQIVVGGVGALYLALKLFRTAGVTRALDGIGARLLYLKDSFSVTRTAVGTSEAGMAASTEAASASIVASNEAVAASETEAAAATARAAEVISVAEGEAAAATEASAAARIAANRAAAAGAAGAGTAGAAGAGVAGAGEIAGAGAAGEGIVLGAGAAVVAVAAVTAAFVGLGFAINSIIDDGLDKKLQSLGTTFKEADNTTKAFTDSLTAAGGATNNQIRQSLALQLENDGLAKAFGKTGLSLHDLVGAVTHGNAATEKAITTAREHGKITEDQALHLRILTGAYGKAEGAARKNVEQQKAAADAAGGAATAEDKAAAAADAHRVAVQKLNTALDTEIGKLDDVAANVGAVQAQDKFRGSLADLTKTLKDNKTTLADRKAALLDEITQITGVTSAQKAAKVSTATQNTVLQANIVKLRNAAIAGGVTRTAFDKLATSIGLIPVAKQIKVDADTVAAQAKIDALAAEARRKLQINAQLRLDALISGHTINGVRLFAQGDVVDRPTAGVFGEAGAEVILPLTKPKRAMELLSDTRVRRALPELTIPSIPSKHLEQVPRIKSAGASSASAGDDPARAQNIRQVTNHNTFNVVPGGDTMTHAQQLGTRLAAWSER